MYLYFSLKNANICLLACFLGGFQFSLVVLLRPQCGCVFFFMSFSCNGSEDCPHTAQTCKYNAPSLHTARLLGMRAPAQTSSGIVVCRRVTSPPSRLMGGDGGRGRLESAVFGGIVRSMPECLVFDLRGDDGVLSRCVSLRDRAGLVAWLADG